MVIIGHPARVFLRVKDLDRLCPYWNICSTYQFHMIEKRGYINTVCTTSSHVDCTHFMGIDVMDKTTLDRIMKSWIEKYGTPHIC